MKLSIVTTAYYSEPYLDEFLLRTNESVLLCKNLIPDLESEIIIVNDGSPDNSAEKIKDYSNTDSSIKLINLSRNFGHHYAIRAGLEHAQGDLVFLIDSDLEEDPHLCYEFLKELKEKPGTDVIYGTQAGERKGGFFERISGTIYYKILNLLTDIEYPHNTLTARLMRRDYVDAVLKFPEKSFDIWVLFLLAGYNQQEYVTRKYSKGISTYTLKKKVMMAVETITLASSRPLYFIFLLGFSIFLVSLVAIIHVVLNALFYDMTEFAGWSSLIISIWMVGSLILLSLGIIAIYLSKIFNESKNRPSYIVKNERNNS